MSCTPRDFFDLALELAEQDHQTEVSSRSSVSRAYYAALHSVDVTFPEVAGQLRVDGESSHAEIIGRAKAYSNRPLPGRASAGMIAKNMPKLRRNRNSADYDISNELRVRLDEHLTLAKLVLEKCDDVVRLRVNNVAS